MKIRFEGSRALALAVVLSATGASAFGAEWEHLFDGETLEGWTQRNGTAKYTIHDGAIVGRTTVGSPNSFLCTDETFGDFELTFDVNVDCGLNSGVQIRSTTRGGPRGRVNGPQVEIECSGDSGAESGYLYGEAAGGWMTPGDRRSPHKAYKDGEWNEYRVRAIGPNIQVWINGTKVSDLTDFDKFETHPEGFIGLQVHGIGRGAGPFEVRWRNIKIRRLDDAWAQLFNGEDLDGWSTTGNWSVPSKGVLRIEPRPGEEGWTRYEDYIWTDKKYGDFVLDFEYAYPEGGNSGVFFRVGDRANPVDNGIEAQVLDSTGLDREPTAHDHGGIIRTAAPSENKSLPPGEWNRMIVMIEGSDLNVTLNGTRIIDINIEDTPIGDRPPEGYIGLQDHGEPNDLEFRNIRILELD